MSFQTVKVFPLKRITLFINPLGIISHIFRQQPARLLHSRQSSRVTGPFKVCRLLNKCQPKWLQQSDRSLSDVSGQAFSSVLNKNNGKLENNDDIRTFEEKDNDNNYVPQQQLGNKSIINSVLLADFKDKLFSGQITRMKFDDWSKLEESLLTENPRLKLSWEALCMSFIKAINSVELSFSLADYIRNTGRSLNIATTTSQIHLIGKSSGPERHKQVLELYKKLMDETNGILDSNSLKNVLRGLCGTRHWKESFNLLEMIEPDYPSLTKYYTPMLLAALREGDETSVMFLLNKLGQANSKPEGSVYTAFLKLCTNSKKLNVNLLLNLMGKYRWFPSRETMFEIVQHFKRDGNPYQWTESWITIKNCICPSCKQGILKTELTNREFRKLQSTFLKKTLIKDDIYQCSHPVELKNFQKFVENYSPFDVVVDALNVACKLTKHKGPFQLRKVIEHFALEQRMKVLVIGRQHMKNWNQADMKSIKKHAKCFFLENITKDDPYLLYATLYSGPKTIFVSADEMRDHKFLLGEQIGEIFTKWQRSRQLQFLAINRFGKVILEWPRMEHVKAQFNSAWHIPYDDGKVKPSWQDPYTWLCLKQSNFNIKKNISHN